MIFKKPESLPAFATNIAAMTISGVCLAFTWAVAAEAIVHGTGE